MENRELDALVAEKVMGIRVKAVPIPAKFVSQETDGKPWGHVEHYSTDIAAAWEVVEKMLDQMEKPNCYEVGRTEPGSGKQHYAQFSYFHLTTKEYRYFTSKDKRVTRAICLAALKAVGVEVPA